MIYLARSPGVRLVFKDRRARFEHRINDSPRLFYIVLACKQGRVALHGVAQQPLVGVHLLCTGLTARYHFRALANVILSRSNNIQGERERDLGTKPQPEVVPRQIESLIHRRRLLQPDNDFCTRHGKAFSSPDIERNPFPAPGIDLELQRRKGFHLGVLRNAFLVSVATELPANNALLVQRRNCLEDFDLFVPDRLAICSWRRLHGQIGQDLE